MVRHPNQFRQRVAARPPPNRNSSRLRAFSCRLLSVRAGDVGVRIFFVAVAVGDDRGLEAGLARRPAAELRLANVAACVTAVRDGTMTRRSFVLCNHGAHRRKLRALGVEVTNPAELADDAVRMRTQIRTEA